MGRGPERPHDLLRDTRSHLCLQRDWQRLWLGRHRGNGSPLAAGHAGATWHARCRACICNRLGGQLGLRRILYKGVPVEIHRWVPTRPADRCVTWLYAVLCKGKRTGYCGQGLKQNLNLLTLTVGEGSKKFLYSSKPILATRPS
jgi:hypothetical protein